MTMLQQRAGVKKTYLGSMASKEAKALPDINLLHVSQTEEVQLSFLSQVRLYLLCVVIFWACLPCYKSLQKFTLETAKEKTGTEHVSSFAWATSRRLALIIAFVLVHAMLWRLLQFLLVQKPGWNYFTANRGAVLTPGMQNNSYMYHSAATESSGIINQAYANNSLATNYSQAPCNAAETCKHSLMARQRCATVGGSVAGFSGAVAGCLVCLPFGASSCIECAGLGMLTGAFPGIRHGAQSNCPEDAVSYSTFSQRMHGTSGDAIKWFVCSWEYVHNAIVPNYMKQRPFRCSV